MNSTIKSHSTLSRVMFYVVFSLALISPALPKIGIGREFNITILEIGLILSSILFPAALIKSFFIKDVRPLSISILIILLSSLAWIMMQPDLNGTLRLIKLILYFQLFYYGYHFMTKEKCLSLSYAGLVAMIGGLAFYLLVQVPEYGFDSWNVKALNSGFSNKYIDVSTMKLETASAGAHGVWTTFCLLAFSIYLTFKSINTKNSIILFLFFTILSLHVFYSVSREGLLSLSIFAILTSTYALKKQTAPNLIFYMTLIALSLIFITWSILPYLITLDFGIIEKLNYTTKSLSQYGTEANLLLRINSWKAFLYSLSEMPQIILTGVGWSELRYGAMQDLSNANFIYVKLPESLFFTFFSYGGIISLFLLIVFYKNITTIALKQKDLKHLGFFLISVIPASILSGAALISDLIMGMLFLITGYIFRAKHSGAKLKNG